MDLELKRKEVELMKVTAARHELEFKILELERDIERIKKTIRIQKDRENELKNVIHKAKGVK